MASPFPETGPYHPYLDAAQTYAESLKAMQRRLPFMAQNEIARAIRSGFPLSAKWQGRWLPEWGQQPTTYGAAQDLLMGSVTPVFNALARANPKWGVEKVQEAQQNWAVGGLEAIRSWEEGTGPGKGRYVALHMVQRAWAFATSAGRAAISATSLEAFTEAVGEEGLADAMLKGKGSVPDIRSQIGDVPAPYTGGTWMQDFLHNYPQRGAQIQLRQGMGVGTISAETFASLEPYYAQRRAAAQAGIPFSPAEEAVNPIQSPGGTRYLGGKTINFLMKSLEKASRAFTNLPTYGTQPGSPGEEGLSEFGMDRWGEADAVRGFAPTPIRNRSILALQEAGVVSAYELVQYPAAPMPRGVAAVQPYLLQMSAAAKMGIPFSPATEPLNPLRVGESTRYLPGSEITKLMRQFEQWAPGDPRVTYAGRITGAMEAGELGGQMREVPGGVGGMLATEQAAFEAMAEGPGGAAMLQLGRGLLAGRRPNIFGGPLRQPLIAANKAVEAAFATIMPEARGTAQRSFGVFAQGGWEPPEFQAEPGRYAPARLMQSIRVAQMVDALGVPEQPRVLPSSGNRLLDMAPQGDPTVGRSAIERPAPSENWVPGMPSDALAYSIQKTDLERAGWGDVRLSNQAYLGLIGASPEFEGLLRKQQYLMKQMPRTRVAPRARSAQPTEQPPVSSMREEITRRAETPGGAGEVGMNPEQSIQDIIAEAKRKGVTVPDSPEQQAADAGVISPEQAASNADMAAQRYNKIALRPGNWRDARGRLHNAKGQFIAAPGEESPEAVLGRGAGGQKPPGPPGAPPILPEAPEEPEGLNPPEMQPTDAWLKDQGFHVRSLAAQDSDSAQKKAEFEARLTPEQRETYLANRAKYATVGAAAEARGKQLPQADYSRTTPQREALEDPANAMRDANERKARDAAMNAPGAGGWRQQVMDAATRISPAGLRAGGLLGNVRGTGDGGVQLESESGKVLLSGQEVGRATDIARGLLTSAVSKTAEFTAPGEVTVADMRKSMTVAAGRLIKEYAAELGGKGLTAQEKGEALADRTRLVGAGREIAINALETEATAAGVNVPESRQRAFGGIRVTQPQLEAMAAEGYGPAVASVAQQKAAGRVAGIWGEGGAGGVSFDVGDYGGGGGGRGRGGLAGGAGRMGSALYSLYIAKRFWTMTGGAILQQQAEYQKYAAQLGGAAMFGGGDLAGAPLSFQTAELAGIARGRAAHEVFSGITDPMNELALTSPAVNRMTTAATAGFGAMALGKIASSAQAMGFMGANPLKAAGPIGAAIGIGLVAEQALLEGFWGLEKATGRPRGSFVPLGVKGLGDVPLMMGVVGLETISMVEEELAKILGLDSNLWSARKNLSKEGRDLYPALVEKVFGAPADQRQAEVEEMAADLARTSGTPVADAAAMITNYQTMSGKKVRPGTPEFAAIQAQATRAATEGTTGTSVQEQAAAFATNMGLIPGTPAFVRAGDKFSALPTPQRFMAGLKQQQVAQVSNTFRQLISYGDMNPEAMAQYAEQFDTVAQGMRGYSYAGSLEAQGVRPGQAMALGAQLSTMTAVAARPRVEAMSLVAGQFGGAGAGIIARQMRDMSVDQANLYLGVLQGDPQAMSWAANTGQFGVGDAGRFFNRAGQPIYAGGVGGGSTQEWIRMMAGQAAGGQNQAAQRFMAPGGTQVPMNAEGMRTAINAAAGQNALSVAGAQRLWDTDLTTWTNEMQADIWGLQRQQTGLQRQALQSQRGMLWGADQGGAWNAPAQGSLWNLEDQQRAMGYQQTMAGFAYSQQRMQVGNAFAMQQEAISGQRMGIGQQYQMWGMGFQRQGELQARGWQREDWQYSDQMRGLQQGWAMEDINEAIRMSSGRQRRQLVTQRERMGITTNLEEEQVDKQRERQEEVWARQDEQFQKQEEYTLKIMELDREQYDLNVSQRQTYYDMETQHLEEQMKSYQESYELQTQIIERQREYQAQEMERSEAMFELSAKIAEKQHELQVTTDQIVTSTAGVLGEVANLAQFEQAKQIAIAIKNMASTLNDVDVWKIIQLQGLIAQIVEKANEPSTYLGEYGQGPGV